MKKPKYTEELLGFIFLCLGIIFVAFGLLSFIGFMKPTASSLVQSIHIMGITFTSLGAAFTIAGIILKSIADSRHKLQTELVSSGRKVYGVVEKVYLQSYTCFGRQSPYRVLYSYIYDGKVYHRKSCFLWEKPDLAPGDSIVVYTDGSDKSVVEI